eukprot:22108-Eustigmatos_ZCMA.PRE.1
MDHCDVAAEISVPVNGADTLQTEQDLSRDNSTFINVAYRTLKDPTLRAKLLADASRLCVQLSLEGINALDEASKTADPSLLMEIMEL